MLRREARLRREYLYRKSLQGSRSANYEKRLAVRQALAEGRPIPTERRRMEASLRESDSFVDVIHDAPTTNIDDEYANATHTDPRIVLTTSRSPSTRLMQFAKEMRILFPNAQRLNRGNLVISELVASSRANNITDLIVLHENRGQPDGMIVSHLPHGPTAYFNLSNVVTRHDVSDELPGTMSEAYPHLIFHNFNSTLGKRVADILKYLFPAPRQDSKRVLTFANLDDSVSFRHHTFVKNGHRVDDVELTEVGPRFEMAIYKLRLGTLDQDEADDEWVLRPYMNTAKRRRILA